MSEIHKTASVLKAQCFIKLLLDRRVPHGGFRVFHYLQKHADANGVCWPGRRAMKRAIGGDFTSLQKWIEALKKAGWLRTEDYSSTEHSFVRERDAFARDAMIYWLLNGDLQNPQPFGKVGTPSVLESRNTTCRKAGTPGVLKSRNESYSNKLTPITDGAPPRFKTGQFDVTRI